MLNDVQRIVVTDSGLGGLDVAARLARQLRNDRLCRRLQVTFVNCKPAAEVGYHDLAPARRVAVFSMALEAMADQFQPDAIFIACNTLSAIYHETPFAAAAPLPVHGIIDAGCHLVRTYLQQQPGAMVVLFGTPVTCQADAHRRSLALTGFDTRPLVPLPCPGLAGAIDRDPHGPDVRNRIEQAVEQALRHISDPSRPIAVALCCTHFGYVAEQFTQSFAQRGIRLHAMLNPNCQMAQQHADGSTPGSQPTYVEVQVVTQSPHSPEVKRALCPLIERVEPAAAAALRHDVCRKLFDLA
jgi:glutamate racemase